MNLPFSAPWFSFWTLNASEQLEADDTHRAMAMDRSRLTVIFNQGFRRGANDRAAGVSPLGGERQPPGRIPSPPPECGSRAEQKAWNEGYTMGYQVGASDAELASVDVPGAHGMIKGMSEQMLEMFGAFEKMLDESDVA